MFGQHFAKNVVNISGSYSIIIKIVIIFFKLTFPSCIAVNHPVQDSPVCSMARAILHMLTGSSLGYFVNVAWHTLPTSVITLHK